METSSNHRRAGNRPVLGLNWLIKIVLTVLLVLAAIPVFAPDSALASEFTVTNYADSGAGSLRELIEQSNSTIGPHTIKVPTGTYTLSSPLKIMSHVTIIGADGNSEGNAAQTIIESSNIANKGVFDINPNLDDSGYNVTLKALTIRNGNAAVESYYGGGGIAADTGRSAVTIYNCVVENNKSTYEGGGLSISGLTGGTFLLEKTIVRNNTANGPGGGIYIEGDLNVAISSSDILNNSSLNSRGGGMTIQPATATIRTITIDSSEITGNSAVGTGEEGGGIYLGSSATISNTTISGNASDADGGGLYYANYGEGSLTFNNTVIENNNTIQLGSTKDLYIHTGAYPVYTVAPIITTPIPAGTTSVYGTAEAGARIVLSMDGTVQMTVSADDSGNWTVSGLSALSVGKVISVTANLPSKSVSAASIATVTPSAPTFNPLAGAVAFGTELQITSTGADHIYYTLDGSDPITSVVSSTFEYNDANRPIINTGMTVKAIAVATGDLNSIIASANYTQAVSADLTGITLSGTPDNFAFAGGTYNYDSVTVGHDVGSITVTPTGDGIITVDGVAVTSDSSSAEIALTLDVEKTITIISLENGKSAKTYTINITRAATVPGAPTGVTAIAGDAEAEVSFSAPASDGGSAITLYTVTSSIGAITATGATSPITINGLTNGTNYTFTVTATNRVGTSGSSDPSNNVTPIHINSVPSAKSPVPTQSIIGTGTVSFTASDIAVDADSGDTLTIISIKTSSDSAKATAVLISETITVTGVSAGSTFVVVRVSDGTATVDVTVPITVTDEPTTYTVSIGSLTGGSITASPTSATTGTSITLTITPETDMQLKAGTLKYNDGTTDHTISGTNFSMPAANVTVTAEFEAIPATPITAPVLQNATTDNSGTQILLTFNKAMNNPAGSAGAFSFSINRKGALLAESVTGITLGSNSAQVILSLAQSLLADDHVEISYTPGTLTSADGGVLGVVNNQSVTNQAPWPLLDDNTFITVTDGQKNLAITSNTISNAGSTPVVINVPFGVANTTINVASLLQTASSGMVTSSLLPALTLSTTVNLNSASSTPVHVQVQIPQGTTVSAPDGWNGTLNLPTVLASNSVTVNPSSGNTATVHSVIEIGYGDVPLIFNKAVRILIPGQAGKKVGYVRSGLFTPISTVLSSDDQATADNLAAGQDGYLNVGSDLVIWTKHFTQFVTYTETANNTGGGNSGGGGSTSGGSASTPSSTTVTGKVLNQGTGQAIKEIAAQVSAEANGTETVSIKAIEVMVLKQPDGTTSPIGDLNKLGFTAAAKTNSKGTLLADGTIQIKNLVKGTESQFAVTYNLGNGQMITIGWLDINVGSQGEIALTCTLIDPYGVITDPMTGQSISGAKVSLYYANTDRNKAVGKTPDTLVPLPKLEGFKPNNNINPQVSDASGAYGFMVFPTTDYYILATKDSYEAYQSPTISVEQDLVKWDFKMNKSITGVKRLAGLTRVDTALEIAKANYTTKLSNVVLATAENYPDALAGSVLAYKLNAPILLLGSTETDQEKILAYLKSNLETTGTVTILGGTAVVSAEIEAKVIANGFKQITRLGGTDRYETAIKISDQLGVKTGTPIVLVYGENYADALAISSSAAQMQSPILLVQKEGLNDAAQQEITKIKPSRVYIVGGEGVISATVESQVAQITSLDKTNIVRIAGADRYATSLAVAQYFNLPGQSVCIATGNNFPDALAGSVYAANHNASIILADGNLSDYVLNYLKTRKLTGATLFGGKAVVNQEIEQQIRELIGK